MTTIYLYGALGRKFQHRLQMDVSSIGEAVRGLMANFPDFQQYMMSHSEPGYRVIVGNDPIEGPEGFAHPVGRQCLKIVPVIAGAAKSPVIGIIIGVVIIAAAIALGPAGFALIPAFLGASAGSIALTVGLIGASIAIGGISQLLAGTPRTPGVDAFEKPESKPSTLFNGPVNTVAQGHPVPIGYGRVRVGSAVISAGIETLNTR